VQATLVLLLQIQRRFGFVKTFLNLYMFLNNKTGNACSFVAKVYLFIFFARPKKTNQKKGRFLRGVFAKAKPFKNH